MVAIPPGEELLVFMCRIAAELDKISPGALERLARPIKDADIPEFQTYDASGKPDDIAFDIRYTNAGLQRLSNLARTIGQ